MLQRESLEQVISKLISQKSEGDFWDFKQEWPTDEKKADLVKDIICFANSVHQQDCYLIFGIDNSYNIVEMEQTRRTQADLIDLLSSIQWAGDNVPHISVKTIIINGIPLDVLIVHNSSNVPFYLKKDYKHNKYCIKQGVIYSREKDRNTGWNEIASPVTIEKLWKKRFHLHEPIIEQIHHLLEYIDEWDQGPDNLLYHRYRPEFTISEKPNDDGSVYEEFFVEYMIDRKAYSHVYQMKYNESTLKEIYLLYLDGCRFFTPYPDCESNPNISNNRYFYMTEDSPKWYLQQIFNINSGGNHKFSQEMFLDHIVLFKSNIEKEIFYNWCNNNQQTVTETKNEIIIKHQFKYESFAKDAYSTMLVKTLLQKYREYETNR